MRFFFYFLILFFFSSSYAAINIPTGLSEQDRQEVLKILGLGTSSKILSKPYPLGGYSGVEVGLSFEVVPSEDLGRLGNKLPELQENFVYPKISLGKGLFEDVDTFIHFIPFNETSGLSEYGAIVRYGFYKSTSSPFSMSLLLHLNSSNIGNEFVSKSLGADIVSGIVVRNLSLYLGVGQVNVSGRFVGIFGGTCSSGAYSLCEAKETRSEMHTIVGGTYELEPYFLAVQMDRYGITVLSAKLGLRF